MNKNVFIVGGSAGIGFELTKCFLEDQDNVYVSARDAVHNAKLLELQKAFSQLHLYNCDVRDDESVEDCLRQVWDDSGNLDLCIYNAGVYESMDITQWDMAHFQAMNDVNYLGALRVINAVTPFFIAAKKGHIACNLSISSYFGLPKGGGYSAPKAALLNFCESIHPELQEHNIDLQVINHGFVKTRLTDKNDFVMPQLLEASEAAQKIYDGLQNPKRFEIRFPLGLCIFLNVMRMLPYRLSLAISKRLL